MVELIRGHLLVVGAARTREVLANAEHRQRVQPGTVTQVDMADESDVLHPFEVAVHRGQIGARDPTADSKRDLLG